MSFPSQIRIALFGVGGLTMLAGFWSLSGCQETPYDPPPQSTDNTVESRPETADVPQVTAEEISEDLLGQTIVIQGEVTQQCPAAGCWFRLKDPTGEVFVDLNSTDIRVRQDRVGDRAQLTGKVLKRGGELQVEAKTVQFSQGEKPDDGRP